MNKRWKDNLRFGILVAVGAVVILWIGDGLEKYVITQKKYLTGSVYANAANLAADMYLSYQFEGSPNHNWEENVAQVASIYLGILGGTDKEILAINEDIGTAQLIVEAHANAIAAQVLAENQGDTILQENQAGNMEEGHGTQSNDNLENDSEMPNGENPGGDSIENEKPEESLQGDNSEESEKPGGNTGQVYVTEATIPAAQIAMEELQSFEVLKNQFFTVDANTAVNDSLINLEQFMNVDLTLHQDNQAPQVLIYHTHGSENYIDSVEGDPSTGVIGVGDYLTQILREQYGYQVIHVTQAFDVETGQLDRNHAYNYAGEALEQILAENPSIEIIIDLHRDGVDESRHLVTDINGKPTAQIMFFNGLSYTVNSGNLDSLPNPYIAENLAFSFRLELQADQYYPEFVRTTYLKGYRYNLHFRPKSLLLECGAQTNTFQEAKNAMEPFADILHKVLNGA
ncbi:MAG: stage II sporulation protein P [Lachnospiraceae bacterium]|nr:stage II sporulation protein P [Lachnospiraceae bacterium]MDD3616311.1 stage II sporulation protein P [Lachnospiraceae bacterium]